MEVNEFLGKKITLKQEFISFLELCDIDYKLSLRGLGFYFIGIK